MSPPADPRGRRPVPEDLGRLLHDLRGPLNSAVMHLEVLKRAVANDATAEDSLRTVQQQLARLADMLPAAFDIAALEITERRRLDLRSVVETAVATHGLSGARLEPGEWPKVHGDETLLALAIAHLVRNALEATPAGAPSPAISAVRSEAGEIVLSVRDWGTGLRSTNPKLLVRLLTTDKRGHRGVGLPIADRIARLHGGALRFEAPPPPGAVVSLILLRAD
jgi:two-component system, NtrC family, sensor histidine kinase HydH